MEDEAEVAPAVAGLGSLEGCEVGGKLGFEEDMFG